MTDQRLRDHARDAALGDRQAQARLLRERVRIGDLTDERLRRAARCGDEGARTAVDGDTIDPPPVSIEDLLLAVADRDEALLPLVMIVVARSMLREVAGLSTRAREACERSLSATETLLQATPPDVWNAAEIADEVYHAFGDDSASGRADFAAVSVATAPAHLAAGRSNRRFICLLVSSAASMLGLSIEAVRGSVATWLLAPRDRLT